MAALALGGTIVANMSLKIAIVAVYARMRASAALLALTASTTTLVATLAWRSQLFDMI